MRRATAWSCAKATPRPAPSPPRRAASRSRRHGWTTGGSMTGPGSVAASARQSCRRGVVRAQGGRGAAAHVPARHELGRLRPCPGGVLRLRRRLVCVGHHPAHQAMAGRPASLRRAPARRPGLRVHLGGRHPLQRPPGGGTPVRPGHRGRAGRRDQGAGGHHRRPSGVGRQLGGPAAGPQAPGHAGADGGRR